MEFMDDDGCVPMPCLSSVGSTILQISAAHDRGEVVAAVPQPTAMPSRRAPELDAVRCARRPAARETVTEARPKRVSPQRACIKPGNSKLDSRMFLNCRSLKHSGVDQSERVFVDLRHEGTKEIIISMPSAMDRQI